MEPADQDWLALCLCTESNRPEEWPCIAQVIENRLKSGRWGSTLRDVILSPMQFSAFNDVSRKLSSMTYTVAWNSVASGQPRLLLVVAARGDWFKAWTGTIPAESGISPATTHYYSPVSMVPAGRKPAWAASASRLYTPDGIDPQRFIFAEGVA